MAVVPLGFKAYAYVDSNHPYAFLSLYLDACDSFILFLYVLIIIKIVIIVTFKLK